MEKEKVCLGAIVGVHGIKGEVKVKSFSDDERHLASYGTLTNEEGNQTFESYSWINGEHIYYFIPKGVK